MRYVYSVIRFVPDPARGETANLGVLVGSDESSEWELRRVDNLRRLRALDARGVLPQVTAHLEGLSKQVDEYVAAIDRNTPAAVEVSEAWLGALAAHSANLVQFTEPMPVLAEDLAEAVDLAVEQFLALPPSSSGTRSPSKHTALAALRTAFRDHGLTKGRDYTERVDIAAGAHGRECIDFVVMNGKAVQLVQAWSFRTAGEDDLSQRVRAWAWAVKGLRDLGGTVTAESRNLDIARGVAISALYVPPADASFPAAWTEAQTAFRELDVTPIPFERADAVAQEAKRLLRGE